MTSCPGEVRRRLPVAQQVGLALAAVPGLLLLIACSAFPLACVYLLFAPFLLVWVLHQAGRKIRIRPCVKLLMLVGLALWCFTAAAFPWVMIFYAGPAGALAVQVWLLCLFLAQLLLGAILMVQSLLHPAFSGHLQALPKIDAMHWTLFSRFGLRLACILVDWYSFSVLLFRLPSLQLPPSVKALVQRLFRMPTDWLLLLLGTASGLDMLLSLLAFLAFLLLVVAPAAVVLVFFREKFVEQARRAGQYVSLDWLLLRLPLPEQIVDVADSTSSLLFLPCLTCFLQLLTCSREGTEGGLRLSAESTTVCWSGWHVPLAYIASALLACLLPVVYSVNVLLAGGKFARAVPNPASPTAYSATGFILFERPFKVLAVGISVMLQDQLSQLFGLFLVSMGLTLASHCFGATNHLALNRFQEFSYCSIAINNAVSLASTLLEVRDSYWLLWFWLGLQIFLWQCFYGLFADQGQPGVLGEPKKQICLRRCIRSGIFLASCAAIFVMALSPELIAHSTHIYHEEVFSYDTNISLRMRTCMLTVQSCVSDLACLSSGSGMIRRWGSLQNPLQDNDIMAGELQDTRVDGRSYKECHITLWPRETDTLQIISAGSSILRLDANLSGLHIMHVPEEVTCPSAPSFHAAVKVSRVQTLRIDAPCPSRLWVLLSLERRSPLHLQIQANRSDLDVRFHGALGSEAAACLPPGLTCLEASGGQEGPIEDVYHCSSLDFKLSVQLQGTRLTMGEYDPLHKMQPAGTLNNSTVAELKALDGHHFAVLRTGPPDVMAFLQPPVATCMVVPWESLLALPPWWLAVMSMGLFPLPPRSCELRYEGCAAARAVQHLPAELPAGSTLAVASPAEPSWRRADSGQVIELQDAPWALACVILCALIAGGAALTVACTALLALRRLRALVQPVPKPDSLFSPNTLQRLLEELPCFWSCQSALLAWASAGAESVVSEVLAMPLVIIRSEQQAEFEALTSWQSICEADCIHTSHSSQWTELREQGVLVSRWCRDLLQASSQVRRAAAAALGQLGQDATPAVPQLAEALTDSAWIVRQAAAEALGQLGQVAARAVPQLANALADSDKVVRQAAAEALVGLGQAAAPAVLQLADAIADSDKVVRRAAAKALGQLGQAAAQAVPQLAEALTDSDEDVRQAAAEALGRLGQAAAPAVPQLAEALTDSDEDVRQTAAKALGQLGQVAARAAPQLANALADSDKVVRQAAAEALGELGQAAAPAVPQLAEALTVSDEDVRQAAAEALGRLGQAAARAVPQLAEALTDSACIVRRAAAEALGRLGQAAAPAVLQLANAIADSARIVRRAAAEALGRLGQAAARAVPQLAEALNASVSDKDVRQAAAEALGQLGQAAAPSVPQLAEALTDSAWIVRQAAAEALGRLGEAAAQAVPQLAEALTDSDEDVRQTAAKALGQLGQVAARAVPQLANALADSDKVVRQAAAEALVGLGQAAAPAVPQLAEALTVSDEDVRRAAAEALGRLGQAAAGVVPKLAEACTESIVFVRGAAAEALGQLGQAAPPAVPQLAEALTDSAWGVRRAAAEALGQLGQAAAQAVPQLAEALTDSDEDVRQAAAEALGRLGQAAAPAVPQLAEALTDSDEDVRQTAAKALGQLGQVAVPAVPQLANALADSAWIVRQAAAQALVGLGQAAAPAVPQLAEALTVSDEDVRRAAAEALGRLGQAAAGVVPKLAEACTESIVFVRGAAAEALGQLGQVAVPAVPQLANALADSAWIVRQTAAEALGQLGQAAAPAVPQLAEALTDSDEDVRQTAAEALGKLGQAQAVADSVPLLASLLRHFNGRVRAAAAKTIGIWASYSNEGSLQEAVRPLMPHLIHACSDGETPFVAQTAVLALSACREAMHIDSLQLADLLCQVAVREEGTECIKELISIATHASEVRVRALSVLMHASILGLDRSRRKVALAGLTKLCHLNTETVDLNSAWFSFAFDSAASLLCAGAGILERQHRARVAAFSPKWGGPQTAEQVYRQPLTHAELSRVMDVLCTFQEIMRPGVKTPLDFSCAETRRAFRAFGIRVVLPAEQSAESNGGDAAVVLESSLQQPRHLTIFAMEALARRAVFLQKVSQGKCQAAPRCHVLPVLRPGWLFVDLGSGLLHALTCFLFALWPCALSLGIALAEEPYATWSPADRLSSLQLTTRIYELPRSLLQAPPLGWFLVPFCSTVFLLLSLSSLRAHWTASLPCTFLSTEDAAAARVCSRSHTAHDGMACTASL